MRVTHLLAGSLFLTKPTIRTLRMKGTQKKEISIRFLFLVAVIIVFDWL